MPITVKNINDLKPSDYNPRIALDNEDPEYLSIKASIEEFGIVEPLIWNSKSGNIVGGHQRLAVLTDLGITDVPVVEVEVDDRQERALNIALNKIKGRWDEDKLAALVKSVVDFGFDPATIGFTSEEFENILLTVEAAAQAVVDAVGGDGGKDGKPKKPDITIEDIEARDFDYTITFSVTSEERQVILKALRTAQTLEGFDSSAKALVRLAGEYVNKSA